VSRKKPEERGQITGGGGKTVPGTKMTPLTKKKIILSGRLRGVGRQRKGVQVGKEPSS